MKLKTLLLCISISFVLMACACGNEPVRQSELSSSFPATTLAISNTSSSTPRPLLPSVVLNGWEITEDQAKDVASNYVPKEVVQHASILAGMEVSGNLASDETHYYWRVAYLNILVTNAWLGWQPNSQTTLDSQGPYNELVVYIDGVSGNFVSREAYISLFIGGPDTAPWTVTLWSPSSSTPISTAS